MKRPAISIGMPVYNGEHFLSRSLDSLLAQDFTDFELIIVDNASLDSTPSICERYARRDSRVRYFRNPVNVGAAPNHTLAFNYSSAPYFKWAAHDDECKPSLLRRCLETFEAGPTDLQLVYPQAEIIDEKGDVQELYTVSIDCRSDRPSRRVAQVLKEVRLGTPMYGLFRSETLKRTRLIDSFKGSDYVLFSEIAMLGQIWEIPEALLLKRLWQGRSFDANKSSQSYSQWLNTCKSVKWSLPTAQKLALEYTRSALRMPLHPIEKVACILICLHRHFIRENEGRVRRWKARFRRVADILFRKSYSAGSCVSK